MNRPGLWVVFCLFFIFGWSNVADADEAEEACLIAFANPGTYLYTMDCSGDNVEKAWDITLGPMGWSPDGQRLAYGRGRDILVLEFETGDITQLSAGELTAQHVVWSPDGERIAFTANPGIRYYIEIYIMNMDGSVERLEAQPTATGITWSPDGQHIAFIQDVDLYGQFLYLIDINDPDNKINLAQILLNECPTGTYYSNPTWSWPTNQLAVAMGCGGDWMDIYLLDMSDDIGERALTYTNLTQGQFLQAGYRGITWSPDGNRIAFVAFIDDDTRSSEIFVLDIRETLESDTPVVMQLTDTPEGGHYRGLAWRPFGTHTVKPPSEQCP